MISKLAKAQESWIFKIIFVAVAISFISLFGVTGYISNASQNQTVVDVEGQKTSQSAFSYRLNREINALRNIAGEDFDLTDDMRNSIAESVLKQIIDEAVVDQTMLKNNIYFPRGLVQQVLFSRPEFQNPQNGQFNPELFNRYLANAQMSEEEYVAMIKRMMARKILINDLLHPFNVPVVLSKAIHKMDNKRKTFKYVSIVPSEMVVERKISDDEIQQYFADFSDNFQISEARDVNVLFVPNDVILKKYGASEEMIKEYFETHKKELDKPERREVLQMVFLNKEDAEKAFKKLDAGEDFNEVARELNAENKDEPTLGVVSYDELAESLANEAFGLQKDEKKIVEIADSWQVIKVIDIIVPVEATLEASRTEIEAILKEENLYDALREARAVIDDGIASGKTLSDVAKEFSLNTYDIKGVKEDVLVKNTPIEINSLVKSTDFNELVFSYGLNEVSETEEFDEGIGVIEVTKIVDAHLPEIDEVKDEIIALWNIQEKNAIAKEIAENIVIDVQEGSDISDAAKARGLEVFNSQPISRNETFANLSNYDISDLFLAESNDVKIYEMSGNKYIVAVLAETINFVDELQADDLNEISKRAETSLMSDMSDNLLNAYAKDLKIEIDYQRAGFSE